MRGRGPALRRLGAGTLAGALLFAGFAQAENVLTRIERRIESTFDLVIGNAADLAIPLTRRALARRSAEDKAVEPLSYAAGSESDPAFAVVTGAPPSDESYVEEGSTDEDVARLPRPRPLRGEEGTQDIAEPAVADGPLDLVAGAPIAPAVDLVAAAASDPMAPTTTSSVGAVAEPVSAASLVDQPILPAPSVAPTPELVAAGACLSPGDVADKDGDFKRNAEVLSGNTFCIAEETFKEKRRTWTLQTIKTSRPGPLWVVMHDDEDMSFDSAVEALKTYGGALVTVDTGGRRLLNGVDPNRNFSADGIGCRKLGTDAAPRYTAFFRDLFSAEPIIALHNNYNGRVSTGGLGHASMESGGKDMQAVPAADPKSPLAGERTLVLLTSVIPVTTTAERRAAALAAKGINAMIETVREKQGDCSLSNYALLTGHGDYLNVTVDHDERDRQRKIIDMIMAGRNDTVATQ